MTAVFSPKQYTGTFVTLSQHEGRDYQITVWEFGKAVGHACYQSMFEAMTVILGLGLGWANYKMQSIFEQDVLMGSL